MNVLGFEIHQRRVPAKRDTRDAVRTAVDYVQSCWDVHLAEGRTDLTLDWVCKAVQKLLECICVRSCATPALDDVRALLAKTGPRGRPFNDLLYETSDDLVPVLVMREIMRRRQIDFDPRRVPHWSLFLRSYGSAIVETLE